MFPLSFIHGAFSFDQILSPFPVRWDLALWWINECLSPKCNPQSLQFTPIKCVSIPSSGIKFDDFVSDSVGCGCICSSHSFKLCSLVEATSSKSMKFWEEDVWLKSLLNGDGVNDKDDAQSFSADWGRFWVWVVSIVFVWNLNFKKKYLENKFIF